MPIQLPSIADVAAEARAGFRAEMPGASAEVWPSNLAVVAKVLAGLIDAVHHRLAWAYDQIFAATADGDHLERHAADLGLSRRSAQSSLGYATGTGAVSAIIPPGRRFIRAADGAVYETVGSVLVPAGGAVTLQLRAVAAGVTQDAVGGTVLLPEATYADVLSSLTVAAGGLVGGANAEPDAELRRRVLWRKANPFAGGSLADYVAWAENVPGCRRARVAGWSDGSARISVYVVGDGRGAAAVPSSSVLTAVAAAIADRRPATARPLVLAPVAVAIPVTVQGLQPATEAVRAAIRRELLDLFHERQTVALPGEVASFSRSWISAAIDAASGEDRHVLVAPAADVALTTGQMPVLGTVTFT